MAGQDPNPLREPLFDFLGVKLARWEPGRADFTLDVAPHHLNYAGRLHGGLVAMLLDVACGYAAMPTLKGGIATVSLAVNFLAGTAGIPVRSAGRVTGGGRRIVFASADLVAEDGTVVAVGQGSFRIYGDAPA